MGWHQLAGSIGWAAEWWRAVQVEWLEPLFGWLAAGSLVGSRKSDNLVGQSDNQVWGRQPAAPGWLAGSSPVLGACSRVGAGKGRQGAGRHKSGAAGSPPTLEQPAGRTFDSTLWCTLLVHPAGWCALGREVPPPPCRPAPQSVPRGRWGAMFGGVGEPGPILRLFPTSTCAWLGCPAQVLQGGLAPVPGQPSPPVGAQRPMGCKVRRGLQCSEGSANRGPAPDFSLPALVCWPLALGPAPQATLDLCGARRG